MKKIGLAVLAVFGLYFAAYSSDTIAFKLFDKIDQAFWPYAHVLGGMRHATGRFLDDWNPLFNKANILSKLDLYEFKLSPKDIRYFLGTPPETSRSTWIKPGNKSRKVSLRYKGQNYKAAIKLHGDTAMHWAGKKKSYQVKMDKAHYLNRMDKFLLILPDLRQYLIPVFASRLAAFLDLPAVNNGFAAVKMNDIFQGIYYIEECVDGKFLERKKISNGVLVELSDNWVEDRALAGGVIEKYYGGINVNDHHDTPFNLEISDVKPIKSPYWQTIFEKLRQLFDAVQQKNMAAFEELVDTRRLGAADAWRTLLGDRHSLLGDNARMVYEVPTGKFFFVPRSEGVHSDLVYDRGSFENWLNSKKRIIPFWEMMARSEKIRASRNEWLRTFVTHEKEVLGIYDQLRAQYEPFLVQDSTLSQSSREVRHQLAADREILNSNLMKLKAQWEYHKAYLNVTVDGNRVELILIPDTSMQSLRVDRLKFIFSKDKKPTDPIKISSVEYGTSVTVDAGSDLSSLLAGREFGFSLDEELRPKPVRYRFQFIFEGLKNVELEKLDVGLSAAQDGKPLPADDIYVSIARATGDLSSLRRDSADDFMKRYPFLQWQKNRDELTLKSARYAVTENVVIPEGIKVIIPAGVLLLMDAETNIVSYSPVDILGTQEEPVVIQGAGTKPFGTFAVVGGEGRTTCLVRHLEVSNGYEAVINGIYFSGALCFYRSDLQMERSYIHDNKADDGLNVKYGKIQIENSRFINNKADQIDLDFCQGVIRQNEFIGSQDNANGDGLDISGSEIFAEGNMFKGILDKGISVGEESQLVAIKNNFTHNAKVAAVKDLSRAFFYRNYFLDNAEMIEGYQKKQIFGGGQIYFYGNDIQGTTAAKQFPLDAASVLYEPTEEGLRYIRQWERAPGNEQNKELFTNSYWKKTKP